MLKARERQPEVVEPMSEASHYPLESSPHVLSRLFQARIFDRRHRGNGIDHGNLHFAARELLDDNIAGKHGSDLVFELKRLMGKLWVAGPKDAVVAKLDPELLAEGFRDV